MQLPQLVLLSVRQLLLCGCWLLAACHAPHTLMIICAGSSQLGNRNEFRVAYPVCGTLLLILSLSISLSLSGCRSALLLSPTVPPKIMPIQAMTNMLREGMRAAISCQILEGDLPVSFRWERNGKPLIGTG